jgi:nucleotide-binding universal stress UspA family protein
MLATRIDSIFHPSDFSEASEVAFGHALRIALSAHASLNVLHVDRGGDVEWSDFPGVRSTLERWRVIPPGSAKSAVGALGIDVEKVIASSKRPVKACLNFLAKHPTDLIVLAVRANHGRMEWLDKRVGRPLAQEAQTTTLFIPQGVQGFVSPQDGSVTLRRILIAVADKPPAQPAVDAVARMIRNLGVESGEVTLLHVGEPSHEPEVRIPRTRGWTWTRTTVSGEPAEAIMQAADSWPADLIAMTTRGSNGFLEALRRGVSQRVLGHSHCPVLSAPASAH